MNPLDKAIMAYLKRQTQDRSCSEIMEHIYPEHTGFNLGERKSHTASIGARLHLLLQKDEVIIILGMKVNHWKIKLFNLEEKTIKLSAPELSKMRQS